MKGKILAATLSLMFLFLISSSNAVVLPSINIDDSFSTGERISFTYNLASVSGGIVKYHYGINCPRLPAAPLDIKQLGMDPSDIYTGTYEGPMIDEETEPQRCFAFVNIIEPNEIETRRDFLIISVPSFSFDIEVCRDLECQEKTKTFILSEEAFFGYHSSVQEPDISARITYPDGTETEIEIPGPVKLNKIGSYSIEVKAGKAGFKDHTVIKQFAVIEKPANIAPVQTDSNVLQWEMIIVILLSLVSVIIYYFLKRKNSKVLPGITPRG